MELELSDYGCLGHCLEAFWWPMIVLNSFQLALQNMDIKIARYFGIIQVIVFACFDFIAQFILVRTTDQSLLSIYFIQSNSSKDISLLYYLAFQHSCCDSSFTPSIRILRFIKFSSFTDWFRFYGSLVIWIAAGTAPLSVIEDQIAVPEWSATLTTTGLTLSMIVNALVTGLIVFKIFKVFKEVKASLSTADEQILGVTGGSTLRRVMFIVIESGMILFAIQLVRLVATIGTTDALLYVFELIIGVHGMLNVSRSAIATLFYW